eukprot:1500207-Pyramimonas_sp.AAC.1
MGRGRVQRVIHLGHVANSRMLLEVLAFTRVLGLAGVYTGPILPPDGPLLTPSGSLPRPAGLMFRDMPFVGLAPRINEMVESLEKLEEMVGVRQQK